MSNNSNKSFLSFIQNYSSKILTADQILYFYSPIYGVGCYHLLALKVMNPNLFLTSFSNKIVTNVLLFSSFYGSSLYISHRKHVRSASTIQRLHFSAYGGILYSFGSVLIWAVLRSALPKNTNLSILVGILSAAFITKTGYDYLLFTDTK